jgi:small GTP-binding protein
MALQIRITGPLGSGKTCLLQKTCSNKFIEEYTPTAGVDFNTKSVWYEGGAMQLHLWGLSGDDKYLALTETYRDRVDGFILMFDVCDRDSFELVPKFLTSFKNLNVPILLVGNKIDDENHRVVDINEAKNFAFRNKLCYMEVSVKTGINLHEMLVDIVRLIMTSRGNIEKIDIEDVYDSDDMYEDYDENILMKDLKKKNQQDLREPLLSGKPKLNKSNKINDIKNFLVKYMSCTSETNNTVE